MSVKPEEAQLSESGSALAWNLPLIMTEPLSWWFGYHLMRRRKTTGRGPDDSG
jgi:hypothetical protein